MKLKKTLLSTAVAATVGMSAMAVSSSASAQVLQMTWSGVFTMVSGAGAPFLNTAPGIASDTNWSGWRSAITGTMTFDTATGAGSGTVTPFSFGNGGFAVATTITMQAIGNGFGGQGTLVLGNMGFNWGGNNGIPVSIVLDAAGMFSALNTGTCGTGCVITGAQPGSAFAATNNTKFGSGKNTYTLPLGAAPVVTTTWNTTDIGSVVLGSNPSGTLPLVADTIVNSFCVTTVAPGTCIGVGGSPMRTAPFLAYNANFDMLNITVTAVPIPAAAWLFGSGLLGLAGIARRKNKTSA